MLSLCAILLLPIWFLWLGRASNEPVALAEFAGSFLASVAMLYGIALLSGDVEEKQAYWEVGRGNIIHRFVKLSGMRLGLCSA